MNAALSIRALFPVVGMLKRFSWKQLWQYFAVFSVSYSAEGKEDKLKAIPAVEQIIKTGEIGKEEHPKHPRKDRIVAFIPITQTINLAGKPRETEVLLGKDKQGNWYYDLFLDESR